MLEDRALVSVDGKQQESERKRLGPGLVFGGLEQADAAPVFRLG